MQQSQLKSTPLHEQQAYFHHLATLNDKNHPAQESFVLPALNYQVLKSLAIKWSKQA